MRTNDLLLRLRTWLLCAAGATVLVGVGYGLDLAEKHYFPSGGPAEFMFVIVTLLWLALTALFTFVTAVLPPYALRLARLARHVARRVHRLARQPGLEPLTTQWKSTLAPEPKEWTPRGSP